MKYFCFGDDKETSDFIQSIIDETIKRADEDNKICTEIEFYPDYFRVKFEPWEPFEYTCPYKEKS